MHTIFVTGIMENGDARGFGVLVDTHRPIALTRGATASIELTVLYPSGVRVDLTGSTIALSIRRHSDDSNAFKVITATLDAPTRGEASFSIASTDFLYAEPGRYVYDIWFTGADAARSVLVPLSLCVLSPTATTIPEP